MEILVSELPISRKECLFSAPLNFEQSENGLFICSLKAKKSKEDIFCGEIGDCEYLKWCKDEI